MNGQLQYFGNSFVFLGEKRPVKGGQCGNSKSMRNQINENDVDVENV